MLSLSTEEKCSIKKADLIYFSCLFIKIKRYSIHIMKSSSNIGNKFSIQKCIFTVVHANNGWEAAKNNNYKNKSEKESNNVWSWLSLLDLSEDLWIRYDVLFSFQRVWHLKDFGFFQFLLSSHLIVGIFYYSYSLQCKS